MKHILFPGLMLLVLATGSSRAQVAPSCCPELGETYVGYGLDNLQIGSPEAHAVESRPEFKRAFTLALTRYVDPSSEDAAAEFAFATTAASALSALEPDSARNLWRDLQKRPEFQTLRARAQTMQSPGGTSVWSNLFQTGSRSLTVDLRDVALAHLTEHALVPFALGADPEDSHCVLTPLGWVTINRYDASLEGDPAIGLRPWTADLVADVYLLCVDCTPEEFDRRASEATLVRQQLAHLDIQVAVMRYSMVNILVEE